MKFFLIMTFLCINSFIYAETLYYKNINTSEPDTTLMQLEFPQDCEEILDAFHANS